MRIVTLIRCDNGLPFVDRAEMVSNGDDGSVSFKLLDGPSAGMFVGQEPNQVGQPSMYGVRYADSPVQGAYQRASLDGSRVTFLTRPQDIPCGYLLFTGQAF